MIIQSGHLVHSVKEGRKSGSWEERDTWMFAAFGGLYELFANVLIGIWTLFSAITSWQSGEFLIAGLMNLFSLTYCCLSNSVVRTITYLGKVKVNLFL
ncbi:hypothetical protein FZC79_19780 [Rossellomorea vietnamensis]|uniref:Uncharacterized protein n=1 Tax=Rossellomorea vietnamensis TaxID=218284 RepID=A0A5D4K6W1_9BACI|nr:hypothetical protein [Rossellomorea vietnamensis]TYR73147.1 hypothetical protein FZC79_19780 [Rossellomorea vietnamensis]